MKNRKIAKIIFSILLLASSKLYADNWYICLGSFKIRPNATKLERKLKENNFDSFITTYKNDKNEIFYRVLFQKKFDTRKQCAENLERLENDKTMASLGIKNLWGINLPDTEPYIASVPAVSADNAENIESKEILVERFIEVVRDVPAKVVKEVAVEKIVEANR